MKRAAIVVGIVSVLVLGAPATARADARSHRLTVAGAILTAVGAGVAIAGATLLSYGALNPPPPPDVAQPRFCAIDNCSNLPGPANQPLLAGAPLLALGASALGSGVALLVVGKRGERPLVALGASGLAVRF